MAIKTVRANIGGTWYTLTNSSGNTWTATITAPSSTSFNQTGGYYNVMVEASTVAGTTTTVDGDTYSNLRLVVKETIKPVITISSPSNGAYVANSKQPIVFTVTDESGGSGVKLSSLVIKLDGTIVSSPSYVSTAITNGYSITYTPSSTLNDGSHTVTITCEDNDGNVSNEKSTTFTVDTIPPTINISSPTSGFVTNTPSLTIRGTTNDATSSPVTVKIKLGGTDQGTVTVGSDGSFSKTVTLAEGNNTIVVTATDAAGKSSSVTRTVTLDTSVPVVSSASVSPNPATTGQTVIITAVIE